MASNHQFKICGLTEPLAVQAAVDAGAQLVGFVFFDASPRCVSPSQAAALATAVPPDVLRVGLFVRQSVDEILSIVDSARLTAIQLHGTYSPEQVAALRRRTAVHLMMAFGIASAADFVAREPYLPMLDRLLYDAKPPKDATRPGGNALAFDWSLLTTVDHPLPWLLAGGLTPENVAAAIRATGAPGVDVSSGVETAPGVKSPALIRSFAREVVAA